MQGRRPGQRGRTHRRRPAHRHRARALQRGHHRASWPRPAWPNWTGSTWTPSDIRHVSVPGALEIPLALKALAESGDFDALVALGCVIRGETYHFELVANESGAGVTRVALDHRRADGQRHPHGRERSPGLGARRRQGPRRRARGGGDGQPDGRSFVTDGTGQRPARQARAAQVGPPPLARAGAAGPVPVAAVGRRRRPRSMRTSASRTASTSATARISTPCCTAASSRPRRSTPCWRATSTARPTLLSPVEHAVLMIGVYELMHCLDIPYRVAINEAVELAKASAAPTATNTSTACSTSAPPSCARPRRGRARG